MDNDQADNTNRGIVPPYMEEDLQKVAKWSREELFKTCKFLYRGKEDLLWNGMICKLFERDCMNLLRGVKLARVIGIETDERSYARMLWDVATHKNLIAQMLSLRRSCVYTVIQNRFNGKFLVVEGKLGKIG